MEQIDAKDKDVYDSEDDEDFVLSENETSSESESNECCDEDKTNDGNIINKDTEFILKEFADWMESCDGGEKNLPNQNIRQVRAIIICVDTEKQSIVSLLDRLKVRTKWLTTFRESKRKPGIV